MTQILKITNYLGKYSLCAVFANTPPPLFSEPEDSSQSAQAPSCLLLTIKRSARQLFLTLWCKKVKGQDQERKPFNSAPLCD